MIKNLEKKSQKEIVGLVKDFVNKIFFDKFPKIKTHCSVIISGSIAFGNYDKYSDIDVQFIFPEKFISGNRDKLKKHKIKLRNKERQIQIFLKNFTNIRNDLNWDQDIKLRLFHDALIVHDPKNKFKALQNKIKWYPKNIYNEKLNWLFAETVFQITDRYQTAMRRNDAFNILFYKTSILQLLMLTSLLLNNEYPTYRKHLYSFFKKLPDMPKGSKNLINKILKEKNPKVIFRLLNKAKNIFEKELIKKKLIKKHDDLYWIDLRPKHKIQLQ